MTALAFDHTARMSTLFLIVYCVLIVGASLAGGLVPLFTRANHRAMQFILSGVAGVMLGVALLHLIPHGYFEYREAGHGAASIDLVMRWALGGLLLMFLLERFFCFHHHEVEGLEDGCGHEHAATPAEDRYRHDGPCDHNHRHAPTDASAHHHRLGWTGAAVGMTIHSLLEGVALAASVEAGLHHGGATTLAGFGTFLVIFLHKSFDSLTIGTLMAKGGHAPAVRHLVNGLFALIVPVGVLLFAFGLKSLPASAHEVLGAALALSAGTFICIALSDVLPELQFHQHDRVKLSAALLAGLAVAFVIGLFEGGAHGHLDVDVPGHEHHDHDH